MLRRIYFLMPLVVIAIPLSMFNPAQTDELTVQKLYNDCKSENAFSTGLYVGYIG
jgi:hypothetical protein